MAPFDPQKFVDYSKVDLDTFVDHQISWHKRQIAELEAFAEDVRKLQTLESKSTEPEPKPEPEPEPKPESKLASKIDLQGQLELELEKEQPKPKPRSRSRKTNQPH